jgi:hypothetical protein
MGNAHLLFLFLRPAGWELKDAGNPLVELVETPLVEPVETRLPPPFSP